MIQPLTRLRLLGALLAAIAFAAGLAAALVLVDRREPPRLIITATNEVPRELERLSLSAAQREQLRPILQRGRDRVVRIVDEFTPRMQAAMDSTDAEIRAILDVTQARQFDSTRRTNPPLRRVLRRSQ